MPPPRVARRALIRRRFVTLFTSASVQGKAPSKRAGRSQSYTAFAGGYQSGLRRGIQAVKGILVYSFTMSLTAEEVLHIARLARIALTPSDVDRFAAQLSGILDQFAALAAVDTEGLEPTDHPLPLSNVMRADAVAESLTQSEAMANAPEAEDGFFRVRAVLE